MTLHIDVLGAADEPAWSAFVDARLDANCYHLLAWKHAAERAYGMKAPWLVARSGGVICGGLPLFVVKSAPLLRYVTTGLFGAYGHVLAESEAIRDRLIAAARDLAAAEKAQYFVLKALGESLLEGAKVVPRWVIATLELDRDPAIVWKRVEGRVRTGVRQAQKIGGWRIETGPRELGGFYDVLAENMHRKGAPIYGVRFMRELLRSLGPRGDVVTLHRDGEVVSGALVITYNGSTAVPFASSRASLFHLRPNNLLYWELLQRACVSGLRTFDFGRSLRDSTTLQFKLGFRPAVIPQPFVIWPVRGAAPAFDVDNPTIRALSGLLKRLPRFVADAVGPQVCRRFLA